MFFLPESLGKSVDLSVQTERSLEMLWMCRRNDTARQRLEGWNMDINPIPARIKGRILESETIHQGQRRSVISKEIRLLVGILQFSFSFCYTLLVCVFVCLSL